MEKIYSKAEPDRLLHILFRASESVSNGRIDITPATEGLQVAYLNMKSEQTFKAHRHIPRPRAIEKTQETWIVVRGSVTVIYYDLDDSLLGQRTLSPGDLTITLEGGHNYIAHSESTLVVEAKTGPFVGVDADKVPLSA